MEEYELKNLRRGTKSPRFGEMLRCWREWQRPRMGVREAAKILSVSPATYCRIEQGKSIDGRTMLKLIKFMFGELL